MTAPGLDSFEIEPRVGSHIFSGVPHRPPAAYGGVTSNAYVSTGNARPKCIGGAG